MKNFIFASVANEENFVTLIADPHKDGNPTIEQQIETREQQNAVISTYMGAQIKPQAIKDLKNNEALILAEVLSNVFPLSSDPVLKA